MPRAVLLARSKSRYEKWLDSLATNRSDISEKASTSLKKTPMSEPKKLRFNEQSYKNTTWATTNPNKLKKLYNKRKHATRIIYEEINTHSRPLILKLIICYI